MKIKAVPIKAKDLKPGDLFSAVGPEYWDHYELRSAVAEKVWLRTDASPLDNSEDDETVYRIEVEDGKE